MSDDHQPIESNEAPSPRDPSDREPSTGRLRGDGAGDGAGGNIPDLPIEYHPTIRPTLIWVGVTVLVGIVVAAILVQNPELFGSEDLTEIVSWVVAFIITLILLRLVIRMYLLRRMTYRVTPTELHREYQLFHKYRSRHVPLKQLRGVEYSRDRIQALLGHGDLRFLTGGTNQSLGFLEFEDVVDPGEIRGVVQELIANQATTTNTDGH